MIIRKLSTNGSHYCFGAIDGIPIKEYAFKKGTAKLGMAFLVPDNNYLQQKSLLIPGFHMNSEGKCLNRGEVIKGCGFVPYSPFDALKTVIAGVAATHTAVKKPIILLCFNEETGEIGVTLVEDRGWKPILSYEGNYD